MGSSTAHSARSQKANASRSFVTPQKPIARTPAKNAWTGQTPDNPIDLTDEPEYTPSKKRKADNPEEFDLEAYLMMHQEHPHKKKKEKEQEEKRVRRFRPKPPQSFHDVYERALSQRFYVLNRTRRGTRDCPEEHIEMTGSTGNIYNVHIGRRPSCTCPHYEKGNQCKHILYVSWRWLLHGTPLTSLL